jgi:hypothetical protein
MKHNGTAVEAQEEIDKNDLMHVSEMHSFPAQDETCLTIRGDCPHCDEEEHAVKGLRGFALMGTLTLCAFAFVHLGFVTVGVVTFLSAMAWMFALGDYPEKVHKTLSRVGL